jgi:hypothetical protein
MPPSGGEWGSRGAVEERSLSPCFSSSFSSPRLRLRDQSVLLLLLILMILLLSKYSGG